MFDLSACIAARLEAFTTRNKTGCRFITADAYNNSSTIAFYSKNGFTFISDTDLKLATRLMCFDLMTFAR